MTNEKATAPDGPSQHAFTPAAENSRTDRLRAYLARRWALVPLHDVTSGDCSCGLPACPSAGKHPRSGTAWQRPENLVITEVQLLEALAKWPGCNWGLATGLISGVWAVDWDPKNNIPEQAAVVAALIAELNATGTWTQRTGSGGQHWVFLLPEDFVPSNGKGRLPKGFDVRGGSSESGGMSGGQIVLSPSVSGIGSYVVLHDGGATPAPAGALELVRPAPHRPAAGAPTVPVGKDRAWRYVQPILRELAGAEVGDRDFAAYRTAARLQALAHGGAFAADEIYPHWFAAAMQHPFRENDLIGKWNRADRSAGVEYIPDNWTSNVGGVPVAPFAVPAAGLSSDGTASGGAPQLGQPGDARRPALAAASVEDESGGRHLKVVRASTITMRATRWLWHEDETDAHWMPLGGLTLLGGREGIGKSTWAYRLAAMLSIGKLPGSFFGEPRAVVVAAGEDAWAQTVVPRLVAAGADLDRVFRVDVVQPDGAIDGLSLPEDTSGLTALCRRERVALVLLDPLMSAVSGKLDTHKDAEVRKALTPLSRLADVAQVGVLGLIHVNKTQGGDLLTRLMGSRAFAAVARSVLVCHRENNAEELGSGPPSFLFGQAKNNLGRKIEHSWRYSIEGARVGWDADLQQPVFSSRIRIEEMVTGGIDDQVAASEAPKRMERVSEGAAAAAQSWLTSHLEAFGAVSAETARPSKLIKESAAAVGHSAATLKRVAVGVASVTQMEGKTTGWFLQSLSPMS